MQAQSVKKKTYVNLNTATAEEIRAIDPTQYCFYDVDAFIAARPFRSWSDVAAVTTEFVPRILFFKGARLTDAKFNDAEHGRLLAALHTAAERLKAATCMVPLKILTVSSTCAAGQPVNLLGCLFDFSSRAEHNVRGHARANVLSEQINGAWLHVCTFPGTEGDPVLKQRNEYVARTFEPHLPLLLHDLGPRYKRQHQLATRAMAIASPDRFPSNGVYVFYNADDVGMAGIKFAFVQPQTDDLRARCKCTCGCRGDLKAHFDAFCEKYAEFAVRDLAQSFRASFRSPWAQFQSGFERFSIPFIGIGDENSVGKIWGDSVDWRANLWSTMLRRTPDLVVGTFYQVTAPEIFELLSKEQLLEAQRRFDKIAEQHEARSLAREDGRRPLDSKGEELARKELEAARAYCGGPFDTNSLIKEANLPLDRKWRSFERRRRSLSASQVPGEPKNELNSEPPDEM